MNFSKQKGELESIKIFKKELKTRNVDIDSKGRPCLERMASELSMLKIETFQFQHCFSIEIVKDQRDLQGRFHQSLIEEGLSVK